MALKWRDIVINAEARKRTNQTPVVYIICQRSLKRPDHVGRFPPHRQEGLDLFRRQGRQTDGDRCRREGKNRQSTNCISDPQESLELMRKPKSTKLKIFNINVKTAFLCGSETRRTKATPPNISSTAFYVEISVLTVLREQTKRMRDQQESSVILLIDDSRATHQL